MANIFMVGDELAKKSDLLKTSFLTGVTKEITSDDDINTNGSSATLLAVWKASNVLPKNAPNGIGTWAIYIQIPFANWIPVQIAFDSTDDAFWLRKYVGEAWGSWIKFGGVRQPANPLVSMLYVPSFEMEVA